MMTNQLALVQREIWEHRSIWITPAAVASVVTLLAIAMVVAIAAFGEVFNTDIAKLADMTAPDPVRRAALSAMLVGNTSLFIIAMWFLVIAYCLDALYAERRDRSILFWRSLPITDAETVVSKLLVIFLVIPLATLAAVIVSHLVNLLVLSVWLSQAGASPGRMIWDAVPLLDTWLAMTSVLLAMPIWMAPLLGWFLFVSAWAKRGPLLRATLPLAVLPLVEYIVFRSTHLGEAILSRLSVVDMPLSSRIAHGGLDDHEMRSMLTENLSLVDWLDYSYFLASPAVWLGLLIFSAFALASVYMRRYRDDS